MGALGSYKDSRTGCYANVRMDNGDPCWISVAQTGVVVKKSRVGLFGAKLYEQKRAYDAAMTAKALAYLYPDRLTPADMTNPVLSSFTNAVLNCSTLAEATRVLNEAVREAERRSGEAIAEMGGVPG